MFHVKIDPNPKWENQNSKPKNDSEGRTNGFKPIREIKRLKLYKGNYTDSQIFLKTEPQISSGVNSFLVVPQLILYFAAMRFRKSRKCQNEA